MSRADLKKYFPAVLLLAAVLTGLFLWRYLSPTGPGPNFVSGNGRLEATEVDIATKTPGRIEKIFVTEGDYVESGQILAQMQTDSLEAQREEALARTQQALHAVRSAESQLAARQSDLAAAEAVVVMRESELDAANRRLARTRILSTEGAASRQEFDDDRARVKGMEASLNASRAQVDAARAATLAAKAQVTGSQATVVATQATTTRIEVDLKDSTLKAPRAGRIQFVIAQAGEVVPAGGKILNLVDLYEIYMTFFLPEALAGKVQLGTPVRVLLDANPNNPLPAKISFVSSTAQFTPKTVETAREREKLMFRTKARIDQYLLLENLNMIKTGMPGVAWVSLDSTLAWPANLELKK